MSDPRPRSLDRALGAEFAAELARAHRETSGVASEASVLAWAEGVVALLIPERSVARLRDEGAVAARVRELGEALAALLSHELGWEAALEASAGFVAALGGIRSDLEEDSRAMFEGDPAARSVHEVRACYPGFVAVALHRVAHALHARGGTLVARQVAEVAHTRTGIDIHPGARIGRAFCIDHGTGVVIGETAEIGRNVKVYHGVTLGALSVSKAMAARKRHPTIEDDVVVYAHATILGGETVIGRGSIIGGNVWVTASVPANSRVSQSALVQRGAAQVQDQWSSP